MGGAGTDIEGGHPVVNEEGKLIPHHRILEQLANQGLLARIPASHKDFSKWDQKIEQRNSGNLVPLTRQNIQSRDEVVVSSARSLPDDNSAANDLPAGAERVIKDGRSIIEYGGKSFNSLSALNAYLS